jgi:chloride channel 7
MSSVQDSQHVLSHDHSSSSASSFSSSSSSLITEDHYNDDRKDSIAEHSPKLAHDISKMMDVETLDYVYPYDSLYREEMRLMTARDERVDAFYRLIVAIIVALIVAFVAVFLNYAIESFSTAQFKMLQGYVTDGNLAAAFFLFLTINILLVLAGSAAVLRVPSSTGPGVAEIKGYLNGLRLPKAVNVKTFFAKVFATFCHVASCLPVGRAGPMIHIGGIIGGPVLSFFSSSLFCPVC